MGNEATDDVWPDDEEEVVTPPAAAPTELPYGEHATPASMQIGRVGRLISHALGAGAPLPVFDGARCRDVTLLSIVRSDTLWAVFLDPSPWATVHNSMGQVEARPLRCLVHGRKDAWAMRLDELRQIAGLRVSEFWDGEETHVYHGPPLGRGMFEDWVFWHVPQKTEDLMVHLAGHGLSASFPVAEGATKDVYFGTLFGVQQDGPGVAAWWFIAQQGCAYVLVVKALRLPRRGEEGEDELECLLGDQARERALWVEGQYPLTGAERQRADYWARLPTGELVLYCWERSEAHPLHDLYGKAEEAPLWYQVATGRVEGCANLDYRGFCTAQLSAVLRHRDWVLSFRLRPVKGDTLGYPQIIFNVLERVIERLKLH